MEFKPLVEKLRNNTIKSIHVSELLPIIWIGEKTEPFLYGWGRLIKVTLLDDSSENYVERIAEIDHSNLTVTTPFKLEFPLKSIVIGGVEPQIVEIWAIAHIKKDEEEEVRKIIEERGLELLVPAGIGYKSYALLIMRFEDELKGIPEFIGELYHPPNVYFLKWDGTEVDIKKLT